MLDTENARDNDFRLRPRERMKSARDFARAFERKRSASDALIVVFAAENGLDYPRLGLSVSRRKFRRAVDRNRFKRLAREAFRLHKSELPPGVDFVLTARGMLPTLDQMRRSLPELAKAAARRLKPRTETRPCR